MCKQRLTTRTLVQLPGTHQPVEKLPWWPLSPQIGHQSAPNTLLFWLLEPDVWSLPAQRRLFQQADHLPESEQACATSTTAYDAWQPDTGEDGGEQWATNPPRTGG